MNRGETHKAAAYRNHGLDAVLVASDVEPLTALGHLGREAFEQWKATPTGRQRQLALQHLTHRTMPEAASKHDTAKKATATKNMPADWNAALTRQAETLGQRDVDQAPVPYGATPLATNRRPITACDLPAGRKGATAEDRSATIEVVVPPHERPWR